MSHHTTRTWGWRHPPRAHYTGESTPALSKVTPWVVAWLGSHREVLECVLIIKSLMFAITAYCSPWHHSSPHRHPEPKLKSARLKQLLNRGWSWDKAGLPSTGLQPASPSFSPFPHTWQLIIWKPYIPYVWIIRCGTCSGTCTFNSGRWGVSPETCRLSTLTCTVGVNMVYRLSSGYRFQPYHLGW